MATPSALSALAGTLASSSRNHYLAGAPGLHRPFRPGIARRGWSGLDVETVWEMPTVFIGSVAQIRDGLQARRDRFGLSYLITPDRELPALAAVITGP
jgi:hypothetical protein